MGDSRGGGDQLTTLKTAARLSGFGRGYKHFHS
jgi:hypothetical protein